MKPHPPTNVKATSSSGGVLTVTWQPPYLPVGLQCHFRYRSTSALRAKPDWEVSWEQRLLFVVLECGIIRERIHMLNQVIEE